MIKTPYTVITGASSGIGMATAKLLSNLNRNLILIARRKDRLDDLKESLQRNNKSDVVVVKQDLSKIDELEDMYRYLNENYNIDVWINNAGFGADKYVENMQLHEIDSMIRTNIEAVAVLSTLFVKDHKNKESQLINVSSLAGYYVWPNVTLYSATKFFVSAFTEGLNRDLKRSSAKLQAKVLAPALTETEFSQVSRGKKGKVDYSREYGNFNTSEDLAEFMLDLLNSNATLGIVNEDLHLDLVDSKLPRP